MDLTLAQTTPLNLNAVEATDLPNTVDVTQCNLVVAVTLLMGS